MKKNKDCNYLDFVPIKKKTISYIINDSGKGIVRINNVGFYNKVAQIFFNRPKFTNIELDEYGTFIWNNMDGKNTIYSIALKVREEFGEKAEPLYERICQYFNILRNNGLVFWDDAKK